MNIHQYGDKVFHKTAVFNLANGVAPHLDRRIKKIPIIEVL